MDVAGSAGSIAAAKPQHLVDAGGFQRVFQRPARGCGDTALTSVSPGDIQDRHNSL
jgi:hypothetical protein